MEALLRSWGKINLTLRVTGRREDGYHDLHTLFVRIGPLETIRLRPRSDGRRKDLLRVRSEDPLPGENLILRALQFLRQRAETLPYVEADLLKNIPPGSGLGAGSGNAAAVLRWGGARQDLTASQMPSAALGADVPFLVSGYRCAVGEGLGDQLQEASVPPLQVLVVIPPWRCATGLAFKALDRSLVGGTDVLMEARSESAAVLRDLMRGRTVGLLPNDFAPALCRRHEEYKTFFSEMAVAGALGWGVSGSGSAAFALFPLDCPVPFSDIPWVRLGTCLEV